MGVSTAALPSQLSPHTLTEPSGDRLADSGGESVSQKAALLVDALV